MSEASNSKIIVIIIVVLAIVGIGLAFTSTKKDTKETKKGNETMQQAPSASTMASIQTEATNASQSSDVKDASTSTAPSSDVTIINVEAGSFYFKPSELKVKKGQKVKIVMHAVDMMHDLYIDELGVKLPITKSGETNSVEFTPEKTGTFEYYCSVGQHRSKGQVGKITVE